MQHQRAMYQAAAQEQLEQQRRRQQQQQQAAQGQSGTGDDSSTGDSAPPLTKQQLNASASRFMGPKWGNFKLMGRLRPGGAALAAEESSVAAAGQLPGQQQQQRPGAAAASSTATLGPATAAAAAEPSVAALQVDDLGDGSMFDEMEESPREGWRTLWVRQRDKKKGSRQYRLNAAASMIQVRSFLGLVFGLAATSVCACVRVLGVCPG